MLLCIKIFCAILLLFLQNCLAASGLADILDKEKSLLESYKNFLLADAPFSPRSVAWTEGGYSTAFTVFIALAASKKVNEHIPGFATTHKTKLRRIVNMLISNGKDISFMSEDFLNSLGIEYEAEESASFISLIETPVGELTPEGRTTLFGKFTALEQFILRSKSVFMGQIIRAIIHPYDYTKHPLKTCIAGLENLRTLFS